MKNIILVTGGAGFVGSNLIRFLLKKTNKKIISLDNYSSGSKENHILSHKIKYISGNTYEIEKKISSFLFFTGELKNPPKPFILYPILKIAHYYIVYFFLHLFSSRNHFK